jgi:prepilin-type N-terminal cleavage/methylation domain-containing protein
MSAKWTRKQLGFTIVELLIVIVVIAILATVSIVAYRGVQDRANDTAVQSDINTFAKKVMLYQAQEGSYPVGGDTNAPTGLEVFPLARGSYRLATSGTPINNFYYCLGTIGGSSAFAVGAISTSGNGYYFSSLTGNVQSYTGGWTTSANICPGMLPGLDAAGRSFSYGYSRNDQAWFNWTK